jgi:hypothetical protein
MVDVYAPLLFYKWDVHMLEGSRAVIPRLKKCRIHHLHTLKNNKAMKQQNLNYPAFIFRCRVIAPLLDLVARSNFFTLVRNWHFSALITQYTIFYDQY